MRVLQYLGFSRPSVRPVSLSIADKLLVSVGATAQGLENFQPHVVPEGSGLETDYWNLYNQLNQLKQHQMLLFTEFMEAVGYQPARSLERIELFYQAVQEGKEIDCRMSAIRRGE